MNTLEEQLRPDHSCLFKRFQKAVMYFQNMPPFSVKEVSKFTPSDTKMVNKKQTNLKGINPLRGQRT